MSQLEQSLICHMPLKEDLSFIKGVGTATFSRASDATYIKDGVVRYSDYTNNLLLSTEELDNSSYWGILAGLQVSADTAETQDPFGGNNADRLDCPAPSFTSAAIYQLLGASTSGNSLCTVSCWVKAVAGYEGKEVKLALLGSGGWDVSGPIALTSEWVRISYTNSLANTISGVRLIWDDGEAGSFYAFGMQLEEGFEASGYSKTTIDQLPRFEKEGLLLESASTNIIEYSEPESSDPSFWSIPPSASVTTYAQPSPDGGNTAYTVSQGTSCLFKHSPVGANLTYTYSQFIKQTSGTLVLSFQNIFQPIDYATFTFTNGTPNQGVLTGGATSSRATPLSDGWWRLEVTATVSNSNSFTMTTSSEAYSGWGAQCEQKSGSTSYIPTEGAAATRAVDSFKIPAGNYPAEFGLARSVFANVDLMPNDTGGARGVYQEGINILLFNSAGSTFSCYFGNFNDLANYTADFSTPQRIGGSGGSNVGEVSRAYFNGTLVDEGTTTLYVTGTLPEATIGYDLNGHISDLRIYDKVLTEYEAANELKDFTMLGKLMVGGIMQKTLTTSLDVDL